MQIFLAAFAGKKGMNQTGSLNNDPQLLIVPTASSSDSGDVVPPTPETLSTISTTVYSGEPFLTSETSTTPESEPAPSISKKDLSGTADTSTLVKAKIDSTDDTPLIPKDEDLYDEPPALATTSVTPKVGGEPLKEKILVAAREGSGHAVEDNVLMRAILHTLKSDWRETDNQRLEHHELLRKRDLGMPGYPRLFKVMVFRNPGENIQLSFEWPYEDRVNCGTGSIQQLIEKLSPAQKVIVASSAATSKTIIPTDTAKLQRASAVKDGRSDVSTPLKISARSAIGSRWFFSSRVMPTPALSAPISSAASKVDSKAQKGKISDKARVEAENPVDKVSGEARTEAEKPVDKVPQDPMYTYMRWSD